MESVPEFVPPTKEEVTDLLNISAAILDDSSKVMDSSLFCTVLMASMSVSPLLQALVEHDSLLLKTLMASGIACYVKAQQDKEKATGSARADFNNILGDMEINL